MDVSIYSSDRDSTLLRKVFKALSELEVKYENDETRVYFSGELDSNCTTFELLSNKRRIGVAAKSQISGGAMLTLLRMLIDNNRDILRFHLDCLMDDDETMQVVDTYENFYVTVGQLLNRLQEAELEYASIHDMSINMKDVDIWTIERLRRSYC